MIYRFTLTYNGVSTEVCEPRDFADFQSEIKRDFESHGVVFKYTSDTLKLGFADGRDILEGAFQLEGFDAEVQLAIDRREDEYKSWSNVFTGNARMESRELNELYFSCDFESSTLQQKVVNRVETEITLDTALDLDGNVLVGTLPSQTGEWNTIRLYRSYFAHLDSSPYTNPITVTSTDTASTPLETGATKNIVMYYGFGNEQFKNLNVVDNASSAIISNVSTDFANDTNREHVLKTEFGGDMNIIAEIAYQISMSWTQAIVHDVTLSYIVRVTQTRDGTAIQHMTIDSDDYTFNGVTGTNSNTFSGAGSFKILADAEDDFNAVQGDEFHVYVEFEGASSTNASFSQLDATLSLYDFYRPFSSAVTFPDGHSNTTIKFTLLKESNKKQVKSWYVYDVFKHLAEILTGEQDSFYSDFFGNVENGYITDGCGALNVLTTGGQLRGLTDIELSLSMKDMLDWASARYGTGWGFEKKYEGGYRIRVEPMEHFYQDNEIMDLGSPVFTKELDTYRESTFNDLKNNTIEIGYSKYNNEIGIDNIFEDFLTKSQYNMPVKTVKGRYQKLSPFIASNDVIQTTFDAGNDLSKSWKYDQDTFIIAAQRNEYGTVPENNENFQTVSGLDDASTAYNIRHAPVYMLLDHALIINSGLMGKSLSELIQNTTTKINTNFSARFAASEDCLLGDIQRLERSSTGNIEIGDNFAGLRLFDPIEHEFTVALSDQQFNTLIDAMEGDSPGYLTYRDDDGNVQTGYLLTASWNPVEGIAQIRTVERADNYVL